MNQKTNYPLLCKQLKSMIADVPHLIANLANAAALLYENLPEINWAGFYTLEGERLVLGPFQGKPACIEIPVGKGVCGTAVEQDRIQRVDDVHQFPGHIACDAASNSEIVLPIRCNGRIWGVLDIDSPVTNRFDATDEAGLSAFVNILEDFLSQYYN